MIEERKRLQQLLDGGNEARKRIKDLQEEVSGFSSTESHCVELNFLCVFQLDEKSHSNNKKRKTRNRRYRERMDGAHAMARRSEQSLLSNITD